jgi:hypothetical protein
MDLRLLWRETVYDVVGDGETVRQARAIYTEVRTVPELWVRSSVTQATMTAVPEHAYLRLLLIFVLLIRRTFLTRRHYRCFLDSQRKL